jgi:hypothetical protein
MADFTATPFVPVNIVAEDFASICKTLDRVQEYLAVSLENDFTHDDYTDAEAQLEIEIDLVRQRVSNILAVIQPPAIDVPPAAASVAAPE